MSTDGGEATDDAAGLRMEEKLAEECANWVAEQLADEFGGFISAEMIDAVLDFEVEIRVEHKDAKMDHQTMTGYLMTRLGEEGAAVGERWGVTPQLILEILNWEDDFRGLAGKARTVRPSSPA